LVTSTFTTAGTDSRTDQRRWWVLAVLCLSLIIVFAGNATLNVAIPTLSRDLHATTSELQWVVSIYSLVFAGALFTTGSLGDRFGRKGALQLGLVGYLLGSVLATFSHDMGQLIACRALMGLAAAFIMPSTLSILINVFPAEERPKAIAIWAACIGAAPPLGPVISGVLLAHFWYGSAFIANIPLVVIALVVGAFIVPKSRDPEEAAFDPIGAITSIVGVSALVYALIEAPDRGWLDNVTLLSFGVAVLALLAFVQWELRVREPMLDIRYFKNKAFSTGTGGMILVFLGMYGTMFLVTQYLQLILGYSALSTAIRLLPMTPIMMIVAPQTPKLSARFGANRAVAGGMLLVALGFALLAGLQPQSSYFYVLLAFIPFISGMALTMSPMTSAIMSAVPARRAGAGSAMNDATRELGAALGIAVLGSIAASRYTASLNSVLGRVPAGDRSAARASLSGALQVAAKIGGSAGRALQHASQVAFIDGIRLASVVGVVLALVASGFVFRNLPATTAHADTADDAPEADAYEGLEVALDESGIPAA
jgi:MFS transporter, DHA2 family, integral membrane protein